MYQRLIRYRTKPDQADANIKLVEAVYAELHRTQPDGVSYATFRLNDQVTFIHAVRAGQEPTPLFAVKAFGEFQAGIADRVDQPPFQEELTEVGSYRFAPSCRRPAPAKPPRTEPPGRPGGSVSARPRYDRPITGSLKVSWSGV